ncbi:putative Na+-transporting ATPase ENA-1 (sodium P-type ATPase ENA-1) [Fusarium austroafricanum]|uniref:P-type Na(+) transporter n=1 Tax=Fusarium austroafricanum TaxID=2364996 RepID=A0A8H4KH36_9HYPO|nr:putative Na+-transporting ATPase ENA-1 (sodium P-type ATPase ENA-1) [Fusarium austroafricanum]
MRPQPNPPVMEHHVSGQSNKPLSRPAHALPPETVVQELRTTPATGLTSAEAPLRHEECGPNDLGEEEGVKPIKIFIAQIWNCMTLVLILALAASFSIQAWIEGGALALIILLNIIIGFFQDLQAARTVHSLKSLSKPTANVFRDGKTITVQTSEIVPGDIIDLKMGDSVPADIRLLEVSNFETNEALLTGESLPVRKNPTMQFADDTGPGDRLNVCYSSTIVTKGRGKGVVFATGTYTEIGAIAAALKDTGRKRRVVKRDEDGKASIGAHANKWLLTASDIIGEFLGVNVGTPLQRKLSQLFLYVFGFAIVCAIIVLAANGFDARKDVIIYAVATAVGTLPVSLILVLTITMAAGTKQMVSRKVVVRNMQSLEALGGVTNICSDKTGTLTQGKMVARMAWLPGYGVFTVESTSEPYNPLVGDIDFTPLEPAKLPAPGEDANSHTISPHEEPNTNEGLKHYLDIASLANLAVVEKGSKDGGPEEWLVQGDPTEIAIQVFVTRFNWNRMSLSSGSNPRWKQLVEFPFDSEVKKMSVIFQDTSTNQTHIFTKGAVERVLDTCVSMEVSGEIKPIDKSAHQSIVQNMEAFARLGLRVLALASRSPVTGLPADLSSAMNRSEFEKDLVFRGLIGIYDPPRPETRDSVQMCQKAGISVHMLTGDHPETARAIAAEVSIIPSSERMKMIREDVADTMVMAAHEFDHLSDADLDAMPQLPLVVARCSPTTKVRMIEALHRRGGYVAMTGDGVNDSPSLKHADVGIAMGLNGSDVAKESSDIILTDDNFASILNAIEEGRRIFDNIQKFILHVLAANVAFVISLLVGLAFKDDSGVSIFVLTPVEIIWMLLVAGAFTETGLGFEQASPDILRRPPHSLKYGVFTPEFLVDLAVYGILMLISILGSSVVVLYGFNKQGLGHDCNSEYSETCETVFAARATVFTTMTWDFLLFAWQLVDFRRSFFAEIFEKGGSFKAWTKRLWKNPFLFWSVTMSTILIPPTIYIPKLNHIVFMHTAITWEWGVVFIAVGVFFAGAEGYKWFKRVYFRRTVAKEFRKEISDVELYVFGRYMEGFETGSESNGEVGQKC